MNVSLMTLQSAIDTMFDTRSIRQKIAVLNPHPIRSQSTIDSGKSQTRIQSAVHPQFITDFPKSQSICSQSAINPQPIRIQSTIDLSKISNPNAIRSAFATTHLFISDPQPTRNQPATNPHPNRLDQLTATPEPPNPNQTQTKPKPNPNQTQTKPKPKSKPNGVG